MKIANHNDQHLCHREEQAIEERSIIDLQPGPDSTIKQQ